MTLSVHIAVPTEGSGESLTDVSLQPNLPEVICTIPGFSFTVERKKGCRLKNAKTGEPAGVDEYFEVVALNDGSNKRYPKASQLVLRFTNTLAKLGDGFVGFTEDVHYWPAGTIISSLTIVEEFDDGKNYEFGSTPAPQYVVWCRVASITKDGKSGASLGFSLASRPK